MDGKYNPVEMYIKIVSGKASEKEFADFCVHVMMSSIGPEEYIRFIKRKVEEGLK